jgi:hypothetical protein
MVVLVETDSSRLATNFALAQINFFFDDKDDLYFRTYCNFFDIMGNIGGL